MCRGVLPQPTSGQATTFCSTRHRLDSSWIALIIRRHHFGRMRQPALFSTRQGCQIHGSTGPGRHGSGDGNGRLRDDSVNAHGSFASDSQRPQDACGGGDLKFRKQMSCNRGVLDKRNAAHHSTATGRQRVAAGAARNGTSVRRTHRLHVADSDFPPLFRRRTSIGLTMAHDLEMSSGSTSGISNSPKRMTMSLSEDSILTLLARSLHCQGSPTSDVSIKSTSTVPGKPSTRNDKSSKISETLIGLDKSRGKPAQNLVVEGVSGFGNNGCIGDGGDDATRSVHDGLGPDSCCAGPEIAKRSASITR